MRVCVCVCACVCVCVCVCTGYRLSRRQGSSRDSSPPHRALCHRARGEAAVPSCRDTYGPHVGTGISPVCILAAGYHDGYIRDGFAKRSSDGTAVIMLCRARDAQDGTSKILELNAFHVYTRKGGIAIVLRVGQRLSFLFLVCTQCFICKVYRFDRSRCNDLRFLLCVWSGLDRRGHRICTCHVHVLCCC